MDAKKQKRLEVAGWKATGVPQFLNLDAADMAYIETKLSLSRFLHAVREKRRLTQAALATALNTSQSRVAKMERGDPSVSVDLLMQALFRLGVTRKEVARAVV